jgi:CubicO group peptidase (beta-lactamase class C family)/predicted dienelactone hydrolase
MKTFNARSIFVAGLWLALAASSACPIAGANPGPEDGTQLDPARLFQRLDADRDGRLTREEFKRLAGLGRGTFKDRPEVFDRIFERLDADSSGTLSQVEFNKLAEWRGRGNPPAPVPVPQKAVTGQPNASTGVDVPGGYRPGPGAFTEAVQDITWTDAGRKRDVPVRIYAPELKHGRGPFPTIVFSHGGGESREAFTYLGTHWARHGYVVVFLTHEGSDRSVVKAQGMRALAGTENFHLRPEDIRFAIDKLVSDDPASELLRRRVDADRIAVAGQCAGSTTALAMVGLSADLPDGKDAMFMDSRIQCAIALSPQPGFGPKKTPDSGRHEKSWELIQVPTLVVTGTRDFNWLPAVRANPRLVRMPYDGLPPGPKYLVEIKEAEHNAFTDSVPYYPARERDRRHHGWIQQATTGFLDAYLKGADEARSWLHEERLEAETGGECNQENKLPEAEAPKATRSAVPGEAYDFGPVEAFLEKSLERTKGGCCLLLLKGDRVVYRKAFGSFTPDKVVPIASASKWISGGLIMALVDEGKISLDDKASKFLPEFTGKKGEITIRQMFSHTHGFAAADAPHRDLNITMAEAVSHIAAMPLAYDPGAALLYSGAGMQVAGRICEIASGKPWKELFREKLGEPLRMVRTHYEAFGPTENPNVAGSVTTCMDDYGNFLRMLLNGGVFEGRRVLSEAAVETMLTNQTGDVPVRRSACAPYIDFDAGFAASRYGIGCWLERLDPGTGRAREATSGGAFGCLPFVDLDRGIGGVYLPRGRTPARNSRGEPYNDVTAVFLELRPIIRAVFDGGSLTAPEPLAAGSIASDAVEVVESLTLNDSSRGKKLTLRLTFPKAGERPPVIVFSHCVAGARDDFVLLARHWASRGYVVLQADDSDSRNAPARDGPPLDWQGRAREQLCAWPISDSNKTRFRLECKFALLSPSETSIPGAGGGERRSS